WDVPRDGLESRRGQTLLHSVLRAPPEIGFAVDRRRLAVGAGGKLDQLGARDPDFLGVGREQRHVLLGVVFLERGRVLRLVVQHDDGPLHAGGGGLRPRARSQEGKGGGGGETEQLTVHEDRSFWLRVPAGAASQLSTSDARSTSGLARPA